MSTLVFQNASQTANVIEVIGMPAVGKSTYCRELIRMNPTYIDANALLPENHTKRQMVKLYAVLSCLCHSPIGFIEDLSFIVHSRQDRIVNFFKVCSNWFLIRYMMRKAASKPDTTFVFDQGTFQAVWSVLFSARSTNVDISGLLGRKPSPSLVIFLDEPDQVLKEREAHREKSIRLDYNNTEHVAAARASLSKIIDYLNMSYMKVKHNL